MKTMSEEKSNKTMVLKKFNYLWLGGKPFSPLVVLCVDSWERFCPNRKIVRWGEKNLPI